MTSNTEHPAESTTHRPKVYAPLLYRSIQVLLALVLLAAFGSYASFVLKKAGERAHRTECRNHLKAIGFALHEYHNRYHALPPAYTVDQNGKPLHSWRTLLLPFLDQELLYNRINLSKPWNDPANAEAYASAVPQYQCPFNSTATNATSYLAIVTLQSAIRAKASRTFDDISDGPGSTLLVIGAPAERSVPWMSPEDADEALLLSINSNSKLIHSEGFQAITGDGAIRMLSATLPENVRRALITIAGNEPIGDF